VKKTIPTPSHNFNTGPSLPLFEHADRVRLRALPFPARRLASRLSVSASTALTIAELAGFKMHGGDR
jgi:hypothetical protein